MKVIVNHIYGPVIKKMHDAGWLAGLDDPDFEKTPEGYRDRA